VNILRRNTLANKSKNKIYERIHPSSCFSTPNPKIVLDRVHGLCAERRAFHFFDGGLLVGDSLNAAGLAPQPMTLRAIEQA
jgi:hypothetical protein